MAIKKRSFFALATLIILVPFASPSQVDVLKDIFIIKNRLDPSPLPPAEIRLGLEAAQNAFFKLIEEDTIIRAGIFPRGFNSISLPAAPLLKISGKHPYVLELKTETDLIRYEIVLEVRLDLERNSEEAEEEKEEEKTIQISTTEHKVSVFIDDELIASRIKILEQKLILPLKESPLPRNYDPFNPDPMDNPFVSSVDILQAAGLALKVLKDIVTKKDERKSEPPIQMARQISLDFRRKNSQGAETQARATISLSTRILQR